MKKPTLLAASALAIAVTLVAVSSAHAGTTSREPNLNGGFIWSPRTAAEAPQGEANSWIDHFDTYATGSQMHGQGGWQGWLNDPAAGALTTTLFDRTAPNSVEVSPTTDLVHPYSGYTSGVWTYTAHVYIPTGTTGDLYFILLNTYPPGGNNSWSTQLCFDTSAGVLRDDTNALCNAGVTVPLILDQWVELRVVIDLGMDTQTVYYGGQQLYTGVPWTSHFGAGGATNIAAVDLFALPSSGPTPIYFDDLSLSDLDFFDGFESGDTREWHYTQP